MGYVIPAGFSRVTFQYAPTSTMGSNQVFGFGVNVPPTEHLLDLAEQWWAESLRLTTNVGYTLLSIEARSDVEVLQRAVGQAGTYAGEPSPPNLATLVKMGSGLVGQKYRGRIFLPGVTLDDEVSGDGSINSTKRASIQGVIDYLHDLLEADGIAIVLLHSDVGAPTLVTTAEVQSVMATQRRRLRR